MKPGFTGLITQWTWQKGTEMAYDGIEISYENGVNTVYCFGKQYTYAAGEILCELLQGDSQELLMEWPRRFIMQYDGSVDNLTHDNVQKAEEAICHKLARHQTKLPVTSAMLGTILIDCIENYKQVMGWDETQLEEWEIHLNKELYDNDYRQLLIPGAINFDSMGGFLKAAYFSYLGDVLDGIFFFLAEAATATGTEVEGQPELHERFLQEIETSDHVNGIYVRAQYDREKRTFKTRYQIRSMLALLVFEYVHMQSCGTLIKKCQNPECGKFFVAHRKNTIYCDFPSPQDHNRTCREKYPQIKSEVKRKKDVLNSEFRKAQSRLLMNMKRHEELQTYYEALKKELMNGHLDKERQVTEGSLTMAEYEKWLSKFR